MIINKIISDLNYLLGDEEKDFEEVYQKLSKHFPNLTTKELYDIALQQNLLSIQIKGGPIKLRRKGDKPVALPPNQNPNQKH